MGKKVILVVDDEPDFLEMIKIRLEANDYEVITAASGKEALDKIMNSKFDAVLLDVLMPGIDGLEVLKQIREKDKNLPVFIITAFSNEERFRMANKLSASGFIVKTSDLKEEVERITGILRLSDKFKAA
ncbi:MAG: response regulator [Candidatus Omnitrophica bacterium]|nr:response regulator [Candidatus Omnitrophota bacterium]